MRDPSGLDKILPGHRLVGEGLICMLEVCTDRSNVETQSVCIFCFGETELDLRNVYQGSVLVLVGVSDGVAEGVAEVLPQGEVGVMQGDWTMAVRSGAAGAAVSAHLFFMYKILCVHLNYKL